MIENLTLAEIVKTKPEAAKLMEKYDLDFCCKGKMKLSDQVKDSVLLDKISNELEALFLKTETAEAECAERTISGSDPDTQFRDFHSEDRT